MTTEHECVFVEEQEPSGRLILPPCIVCGCTAMDALDQLREWEQTRADDLAKCRERLADLQYRMDKFQDDVARIIRESAAAA